MENVWTWKTAVALGTLVILSFIYNKRRRSWRAVGKLAHLYIYPLKSGRFIELDNAECTELGLRVSLGPDLITLRDRVFGIYSEQEMELVTARKYPTFVLITVQPKNKNELTFSHPDFGSIDLTIPDGKFNGKTVTLWRKERIEIVDCGDEVSKWVSRLALGQDNGLRMAYWPENETWRRNVLSVYPEEIGVFKKFTNKYSGAYTDLVGYLLMNQSSVDDLNTKLVDSDTRIGTLNFRPNFVIEGALPYDEDKWDRIKIGEVEFTNFRPCTRCLMTTVDYKTGKKHPDTEPLKTLRKYRTMKMLGEARIEPSIPVLGVFVGLEKQGVVKAGDTVYVS